MKKELIFELSIYAVSLILVASIWNRPVILTVCYGVISSVVLFKWHTNRDISIYLVAFILGSIAESVAVYFGAWEYSEPFYLIPLWLPFVWGIAALLIKNISETLLKIRNEQKLD
jgi:uncharacterized membrane protein YoaT (DUF817 family)